MNVKIPDNLRAMLASPDVRRFHHLWHLVRNEESWLRLPAATRSALEARGWKAPRFEQEAGSGIDFLYMHRVMIKMVDDFLVANPSPHYDRVVGWNPIPFDHSDATWPMPPVWSGAADAFRWAKEPATTDFYRQRVVDEFENDQWLASKGLDELGSELEWSIHGWMHLHWSEPTPSDPFDESVSNDWLGAPFSSHVNDAFWKLHGWIDERIDAWEKATGTTASFDGAWSGPVPESAPPGHSGMDHHVADRETFNMLDVHNQPLKVMTWMVPIIEGVTDQEMLVQTVPRTRIEVEGTSLSGSFQEALAAAIAEAKQRLRTDAVEWRLLDVSGKDGGFVQENVLRVRIDASVAQSDPPHVHSD